MFGLFLYFFSILLVGWCLTDWLFLRRQANLMAKIGLAYVTGSALFALELFIAIFGFGFVPNRFFYCLFVLPIVIVWLIFGLFKKRFFSNNREKLKVFDFLPLTLLALQVVLVMGLAWVKPVMTVDSVDFWSFKPRVLFYDSSGFLSPDSYDYWAKMSHADYPWQINLLIYGLTIGNGFYDDALNNYIFVGYYLSALLILYGSLTAGLGKTKSLLMTYFLASLPLFFYHSWNAYADLPLATNVLASLSLLLLWLESEKAFFLHCALAVFLLGTQIKFEGIYFLLSAILIVGFKYFYKKDIKMVIFCFWPLLVYSVWQIFIYIYGLKLVPASVPINFEFHPDLFLMLLTKLFYWHSSWNILWYVVLLYGISIVIFKRSFNKKYLVAWLWLFLVAGFFICMYLFTPVYIWAQDDTALSRNILTLIPALFLLIGFNESYGSKKL